MAVAVDPAERRAQQLDLVRETLAEAREAYEEFADAMSRLGPEVRRLDDWMYQRVDAYPGWHGSRDVGCGQSMIGWLEELEQWADDVDARL